MPSFTYTNNIPNAANNPSVDQPPMQVNNNSIASLIAIDHFGFNSGSGGSHKQVTLTNESAPGLGDGNGVLFANLQNSNSWPFWQNAAGTTQLIGGISTAAQQGQLFLPGGIIFIWDKITSGLNTTGLAITFAFGGFPNNCFNVIFTTAIDDNSTIRMGLDSTVALSKTGCTTQQTASSHLKALYYLAIGN
jgi:hypothetical protein